MKEATDTKEKTGGGIWTMIDRIQGDKVIWLVLILLILYSTVAIFSSTSLKATAGETRLDIFMEHMVVVGLGMAIVFILYFFVKIGFIRILSQFCFALSAVLLLMLVAGFHVVSEDEAARAIRIFGFDLQVYEFVKVLMVLYLAWAVQAYKTDSYWIANKLSGKFKLFKWLGKPGWKRIFYIHLPIIFTTICIMKSGFSSAVFTAVIMILTVLIAGIPKKDIGILLLLIVLGVGFSFVLWKATGWAFLGNRWETVESRLGNFFSPQEIPEKGSREYQAYIDEMRQPEGAKLAVHEGGFFGKGPGRSTQRYAVAEMYGDYMFCFILEEYGLVFGAIPLILCYLSLLARGSIIVRYCTNEFSKTVVAGLTLLITMQAMMHMYINVGLGPLTGQTLPMISYGRSSFVAFSIAFGILLLISKTVKQQVAKAEATAAPLVDRSDDDIQSAMDELDALDSME